MNIKKHIPNILTLTNLFSGCILVYYTITIGDYTFKESGVFINIALVLLGISLLADLLDGMVARWLNVASPIGLQLDSLADMVTFGVFPGFLMFKMFQKLNPEYALTDISIVASFGLLITLFSALRLAKFNVDTTQVSYFKGLATPANTILIFGIYILIENYPSFFEQYGSNTLIAATVISSFLLVSDLPLFSFKIKSFKIKYILPQLILLIVSVLLLFLIGLNALVPIILIYIILSIIFKKSFVHA